MSIKLDENGNPIAETPKKEQTFEAPKTAAAPAAKTSAGVTTYKAWDGSEIKLSLKTAQQLVEGGGLLTEDEFFLFAAKCKARSLNPFTKECYPIKFQGANAKVAIIENWNNFVRVADESQEYDGMEDGLVVVSGKGELKDIEGQIVPPNCQLVGAWCKVYRKDRKFPFVSRIDMKEFAKTHAYDRGDVKKGDLQGTWSTMPAYMISKCAKSIALRLAFPQQLAGSYIAEEMQPRVVEDAEAQPLN